MKYYSHINGLRAISVLLILFYHADFEVFKYGFIGVDVFFVISGYVITLQILFNSDFNYYNFINKRIRRIFPALFFMCLIATIFAWFLLTPKELKDYGRSLLSSINFLSNFYFWQTQNYHGQLAQFKPLIHTWSLSVEWQFYIFFPILFIYYRRIGKPLLITLVVLSVASLLLQVITNYINMEAVSFYLAPSRAWEFLLGSIAAILQNKIKINKSEFYNSFFSFIGMIFIFFAGMFPLNNVSILQNILAAVGCVLVISFSNTKNFCGKFLNLRILEIIGAASFSIYLYHQPIFVFFRHSTIYIDSIFYVILIIISLIIGYFSFFYIEKLFKKISIKYFFINTILLWLILLTVGILFHYYDGFPSRYGEARRLLLNYENYDHVSMNRTFKCLLVDNQKFEEFPVECFGSAPGNKTTIIWGDSHAAGLFYGFSKRLSYVAQFTISSCPPFIDEKYNRPLCNRVNSDILNIIKKMQPKEVYLHAYWIKYNKKSLVNIAVTVNEIKKNSPNTSISIIGNTPNWNPTLPLYIDKYLQQGGKNQYYLPFKVKDFNDSDNLIHSYLSKYNVNFISALNFLCEKDQCIFKVNYNDNQDLIFYDSDHLTRAGSQYISDKILR
jgi:peptidoglycan/LPS O-acetylase OafA/YrhL